MAQKCRFSQERPALGAFFATNVGKWYFASVDAHRAFPINVWAHERTGTPASKCPYPSWLQRPSRALHGWLVYVSKNQAAVAIQVRKRHFSSTFYTTNDHFTKTGSGQTWEKHSKRCRFRCDPALLPRLARAAGAEEGGGRRAVLRTLGRKGARYSGAVPRPLAACAARDGGEGGCQHAEDHAWTRGAVSTNAYLLRHFIRKMILFCQDGLGTTTGKALKKRCVCLQDAAEPHAAREPTQARHRNDRSGRTGGTSGRKKQSPPPPPCFSDRNDRFTKTGLGRSYGNLTQKSCFPALFSCRWLEICVRGFRCEKRHFLR